MLNDWFKWWHDHRTHIFCAVKSIDAPSSNLAEIGHDKLCSTVRQNMSLLEAAIASTSDKGSPNVRLYNLHGTGIPNEVCYKTVNLFAPAREIFSLSDAPYLIKTLRNNFSKSGTGKNTKHIWINCYYGMLEINRDVPDTLFYRIPNFTRNRIPDNTG